MSHLSATAHEHRTATGDPARDASGYLDLLFGAESADSLVEVRTRRPGQDTMRRWFVRVDARRRLAARIPALAQRADVYVGCAPRQTPSGRREAITHAWVAWVDADGPAGRDRVACLTPAPTLIVASGSGGVHAYWRLDRPADVELVEEINRRLAHAAGGDPVWAITSILRPPSSRNFKHRPAAPVGVAGGSGEVYDPAALCDGLAPVPGVDAPTGAGPPRLPRPAGRDPLLEIAPREYVRRLLGVEVPRSGFISCPWHEDQRPSLKVYDTPRQGWYCYSARCRRGGTIYDLAAAVWGMSTRGREFAQLRARLHDLFPEARP